MHIQQQICDRIESIDTIQGVHVSSCNTAFIYKMGVGYVGLVVCKSGKIIYNWSCVQV